MSGLRRRAAPGRMLAMAWLALFWLQAPAQPDNTDVDEHVAPPPPAQPMPPMSEQEMGRVMDMHDDPLLGMFKLDQFEHAQGGGASATDWEAEAWIGRDFDKFWLRSEGGREDGYTDARLEAFWDHAFASYWDWQLGARHDFGSGPNRPLPAIPGLRGTGDPARRDWAAFGVQGIAPYWFEIEATAYVGDGGRTALRLRAQYELLLTQRLILQPEFEANLYGKRDRARGIADGLSDAGLGLRLRYEIRREIAPYIGIVRKQRFGDADFAGHAGSEIQFVTGLRVWF
jgi:copper resistance protein B